MSVLQHLKRPDGETLAYRTRRGRQPTGVLWLGGLASDMIGAKATMLDSWAADSDRSFTRFDYFGHGESSGAFVEGTIGRWTEDALAIFDACTDGPQILVGSSMGGWVSLLVALARPERVKGMVLIAPAPDFTEDLMWDQFSDDIKALLNDGKIYEQPSLYDDNPYLISPQLIEDGRQHLLLRKPIEVTCPIRILHGMQDIDVPWRRSLTLVDQCTSDDISVTFVKNADHRMSDEINLSRLRAMVTSLCEEVEGR